MDVINDAGAHHGGAVAGNQRDLFDGYDGRPTPLNSNLVRQLLKEAQRCEDVADLRGQAWFQAHARTVSWGRHSHTLLNDAYRKLRGAERTTAVLVRAKALRASNPTLEASFFTFSTEYVDDAAGPDALVRLFALIALFLSKHFIGTDWTFEPAWEANSGRPGHWCLTIHGVGLHGPTFDADAVRSAWMACFPGALESRTYCKKVRSVSASTDPLRFARAVRKCAEYGSHGLKVLVGAAEKRSMSDERRVSLLRMWWRAFGGKRVRRCGRTGLLNARGFKAWRTTGGKWHSNPSARSLALVDPTPTKPSRPKVIIGGRLKAQLLALVAASTAGQHRRAS